MKKSKIISLLSSVVVVSATTPIVATACSNNKLEITIANMPDKIVQGKQSDACKVIAKYKGNEIKVKTLTVSSLNDYITGEWNDSTQKVKFKALATAPLSANDVDINIVTEDDQTWNNKYSITIIDSPEEEHNYMVYDGKQYRLADNIDPNSFCISTYAGGSAFVIPLYYTGKLTIDFGNNDQYKITSITLKHCGEEYTTIGDSFLRDCEKLESLDLSGLGKITKIESWFMMNCESITSLNIDFDKFTNLQTIGSSFLANCTNFNEVDLSGLLSLTKMGINFLQGCSKVTDLWVPFKNTPPTPSVTGTMFPANLKHIHCGEYLSYYQNDPVWGLEGIKELLEY